MENKPQHTKLKRGLGLVDSSMLIMGSMIGSGIFIVSADIAKAVESPGWLLLSWVAAGLITIFGALSYGELAAAMPKAGGQYIYLKEAWNKLTGFLYGWTLFTVIQTGTIAAVGVGFAKYTGVFLPSVSAENILIHAGFLKISSQQMLAIGVILFLTFYNFRTVKAGALLQNVFTVAKIFALFSLILFGLYKALSGSGDATHFTNMFSSHAASSPDFIWIFGAALLGSLFACDAWNNITFTAGEIENPQKNLPRSLVIGTGTVILLYFLVNVIYIYILPMNEIADAPNQRVATVLMERIMGNGGAYLMAALIMISTFGCLNGIILTGARVYYAMANDKLFFNAASRLNKNDVPSGSLAIQGIWASILALSGSYSQLLGYVMFAVLFFYILTVIGIFILRKKKPDMERPYRAFGYPVLPALYIGFASFVCIALIRQDVLVSKIDFNNLSNSVIGPSLSGLLIVIAGVPVYYLIERFRKA